MTVEQIYRDLVASLGEIKSVLGGILDIEDAKYEALRTLDIEKLVSNNGSEEELLSRFDSLEKKRMDLVEKAAMLGGFNADISLSEMIPLAPEGFKAVLTQVSAEIRTLTERMSIAADRNRHILVSNSELVAGILDLMEGRVTQNYDHRGGEASNERSLHILDHTV